MWISAGNPSVLNLQIFVIVPPNSSLMYMYMLSLFIIIIIIIIIIIFQELHKEFSLSDLTLNKHSLNTEIRSKKLEILVRETCMTSYMYCEYKREGEGEGEGGSVHYFRFKCIQ